MNRQYNPKHGHFKKPEGYKDLGTNNENAPERKACYALRHKVEEYDNSLFMHRGTDIISTCHECKVIWHTDMSD